MCCPATVPQRPQTYCESAPSSKSFSSTESHSLFLQVQVLGCDVPAPVAGPDGLESSRSNAAGADHDFVSGGGADSRRGLGGSGKTRDGSARPNPSNGLGQSGRRAAPPSSLAREVTIANSRLVAAATGFRMVGDGAATVAGVPCDESVGEREGEIGKNGDRQRRGSVGEPLSRRSAVPTPVPGAAARCESRRTTPEWYIIAHSRACARAPATPQNARRPRVARLARSTHAARRVPPKKR